jgi:hypothetical protein
MPPHAVGGKRWSCRHRNVVVQELWREVGTVRPNQGVKLRMDPKAPEHLWIVERLEDWPVEH